MDILELARTHSREEFERILAERDETIRRALRTFQGALSLHEIHEGIRCCVENAESLRDDANLLLKHERWARSFALTISASEEVGKVVVLHSMAEVPSSKPKAWVQHWKEARCHTAKTLYAGAQMWHDRLYSQIGAQLGGVGLDEKLLERLRQGGLYVDFDEERQWRTPKEIVKKMAEEQFHRAENSLARLQHYQQRGLFEIAWLKRRAVICGSIYDTYEEIPKSGAQRSEFFIQLHRLREQYFDELVNQGVLERFDPSKAEGRA